MPPPALAGRDRGGSAVILERAVLRITPGGAAEFEAAFEHAREVVAQSTGYGSLRLLRGIERPDTYLLLIEWDTVADHMEGFRQSELYERWSALLRPHFSAPPEVEHFTAVIDP
ncbi:MAG: antibiotic biosynthesis monooxygenase [Solirubrobacteraceae bacterium]